MREISSGREENEENYRRKSHHPPELSTKGAAEEAGYCEIMRS